MQEYKIIGDSCCDYSEGFPGEGSFDFITRVPLTIALGEKSYTDTEELDCAGLIADMAGTKQAPKSACPAPSAFVDAIGDAKDAYIVTLSERVSGTYNSAVLGAEMAKEARPELNVHVFNSRSAAAGEIAICCKLKELAESGMAFDEVVAQTEAYINDMTTFFVLETLDVFRKNGRLSHLQAITTAALRIRLIMGADENGAIVMRGKALTMKRALSGLVELIRERYETLNKTGHEILYITHCACRARADELKSAILETCPGVKTVVICRAGGISTIYANAGGVVIGF